MKSFVFFALGFAISQGGIAARTPTRMQGSEVKERKEIGESSYSRNAPPQSQRIEPVALIGTRMPFHYTIEKSVSKRQTAVFNL